MLLPRTAGSYSSGTSSGRADRKMAHATAGHFLVSVARSVCLWVVARSARSAKESAHEYFATTNKKKKKKGRRKKKGGAKDVAGGAGGGGGAKAKQDSDEELEEEIADFDAELEQANKEHDDAASEAKGGAKESKDGDDKGSGDLLDTTAGEDALHAAIAEECIWDQDTLFEEQIEMMLTLERIAEHFCAATMSIRPCKELDAAAIIVNGCIVAVADAIMRRRATDHPSEACSHLMGQLRDGQQLGIPGFGLSVSSFASQTATDRKSVV